MGTANQMGTLPPGTPLLAKTPRAVVIFDMSARQLYEYRRLYPDFPAFKIGRDVYFDVPRCYAWFGANMGGEAANR